MKKPFYKDFWFYFLSFIALVIIALFIIPYGLNNRSVGSQLVDTAEQFTEQYVYDEKDHWTEEEWNEYWEEHPEYTAYNSQTDWESFPSGSDPDDPRLDELPFDYSKLWNIDFSDLEETEQYDALLNKPITNEDGEPLPEEHIYREKSTGDQIINVTLDGFILRLDSSYRANWADRDDSDVNGFRKFQKALNLRIIKNMGDKACRIEIAPHDWVGPVYNNESIEHPLYDLTMRYDSTLHTPEEPRRFLTVKLDEAPYNTDTYAITIDSISPKECFDANLEMEILEGMTFLPPELKEQGMDYDELNRFPEPYYWPKPVKEGIEIKKDGSGDKQIVEYEGFSIETNPKWQVIYDYEREKVKIVASRRCDINVGYFQDWQILFEEKGAKNLDEYFEIVNKPIIKPDWGIESISGTSEKISNNPYEIHKNEGVIDLGDGDKIINGGYLIKNKERIASISWKAEDPFEDVREGDCEPFGEAIFDSFKFLE